MTESPQSLNSSTSTVAKNLSSEDEPLTLKDCVDLASAVRYCSNTLIEGSWSEEQTVRGKRPIFTPKNFDSAKAFLRASVESLHTRRKSQSLSDTPLTSHSRHQSRMPTCHGCHGQMGQGQHQGSAPGKDLCSLPHSFYCRGGVIEDTSWRACPPGYLYNSNLDLANGTGFESTLGTQDFLSSQGLQQGPAYSTPLVSNPGMSSSGSTMPPPPDQISLGAISRLRDERLPGMVQFSDNPVGPPAPRLPPTTNQNTTGASGTLRSGSLQGTPDEAQGTGGAGIQAHQQIAEMVQAQIDAHRASNQVENDAINRPSGIKINDLRRNENLRSNVENYMDTVIRRHIPALAPPPSATSATVVTTVCGLQGPSSAQSNPNIQIPLIQQFQSQYSFPQPRVSASPQQHQQPSQPTQYASSQQQVPMQQAMPQQIRDQQLQGQYHVTSGTGVNLPQPGPAPHPTVSYRTEFRCSPTTGRQWQVQVPVTNPPQPAPVPQFRTEWRIHPFAGTPYQVQVPVPPQAMEQHVPTQPYHVTPPQNVQSHQQPQPAHLVQPFRSVQQQQEPPQLAAPLHIPSQETRYEHHQSQYEWRIDPNSGAPYQVQVLTYPHQQVTPQLAQQQPPPQGLTQGPQVHQLAPQLTPAQDQHPAQHAQHVNHQQQGVATNLTHHNQDMSRVQHSFSQYCDVQDNASLSRPDRVAGIVSLLDGGGGTTRKLSKVIDFARKCPVRWSKQATMANISLPLYAWGAVAELEASLSGRAEAMQGGVLLGKLRNLQNILEVCCLSSSSTDFTGYGWTLARDYASKVDNDVEQQLVSWQNMQAGVRTATLVSAQMEHPRPVQPKETKKLEKKDICTTYNKCKTEGKCDYEVSHPGKSCQRRHECSYCKEKKKQSFKHQVWNCQSKLAAEG